MAAKKLLNYLQRYSKDRPTTIEVSDGLRRTFVFTVEWTNIKKQGVLGIGAEGEWYNILSMTEAKPETKRDMRGYHVKASGKTWRKPN